MPHQLISLNGKGIQNPIGLSIAMKKITILHFFPCQEPYGTERHLSHLFKYLNKDLFSCCFLGIRDGMQFETFSRYCERVLIAPSLEDMDGNIDHVALHTAIANFVHNNAINVIHCHVISYMQGVAQVAESLGLPSIGTIHHPNDSYHKINKKICVSNSVKQSQKNQTNCITIYNGVELDHYKSGNFCPASDRSKLGISSRQLVVGFIGRFVETKRPKDFLECALEIGATMRDVTFLMLGAGSEESELQQFIHENKMENVSILPPVVDPRPFYSILDILLCPAYDQGFGYVYVEAMAFGVPIVSYKDPTNSEIIQDGVEGILVPVSDTKALTRATVRLLESESLRQQMGQRAIERSSHFDVRKTVRQTEQVYIDLCA